MSSPQMTRALLVALTLALAAPAAEADVLEVPADHATVQGAVDAAASGDLIVVAPGFYSEVVLISGKGLTLVGDGGSAEVVRLAVENLPNGETVVLRSVSVPPQAFAPSLAPAGLTLTDNLGSVRIENCEFRGMSGSAGSTSPAAPPQDGGNGAVVIDCADVVFHRTLLQAGAGASYQGSGTAPTHGGIGLLTSTSNISVIGGSVAGGAGGSVLLPGLLDAGHGGDGVLAQDDTSAQDAIVFLAGTRIGGGDGGSAHCVNPPCGLGGAGGDGLETAEWAKVKMRDIDIETGDGGLGSHGFADDGVQLQLLGFIGVALSPKPHRAFGSSPGPLRPGDAFSLDFDLEPGDIGVVLVSLFPEQIFFNNLAGNLLVQLPPLLTLILPQLSGPTSLNLTAPPPPGGVPHFNLHLQLVTNSTALLVGPATVLTFLDN